MRTIAQMDTIPKGTILNVHHPEWTQSRMETIPIGHHPEWTQFRMDTIPNEHLHSHGSVVYAILVRTFNKDDFNQKLIFCVM